MSRAAFETEEHRAAEEAFAIDIAIRHRLRQFKLSECGNLGYKFIDRCFHTADGEVKFFAELKCRNQKHDQFPTLILSAQKWERLVSFRRSLPGTPVYLMVRYTDGDWGYSIPGLPPFFPLTLSGPNPPRDGADIEPCITIPRSLFQQEKP